MLTVVRYVERNPLRAGLVARAEDWNWTSLRVGADGPLLGSDNAIAPDAMPIATAE